MIKQLTDEQMEHVSGGFMRGGLHEHLIAEIGPMRLTAETTNTTSESAIPISADVMRSLRDGLTVDEPPELRDDLSRHPFFRNGSAAFSGTLACHPDRRGRSDRPAYRDNDRAMARQARSPATLSWKTNYLSTR